MEPVQGNPSATRLWLATAAIILLVLAVWKVIDWRMQPPPPPQENVIGDR